MWQNTKGLSDVAWVEILIGKWTLIMVYDGSYQGTPGCENKNPIINISGNRQTQTDEALVEKWRWY